MIAPRLVISAGVVAMALASVGAHDTAKAVPKADQAVQDLLAGVGRHEASPKVMKALRAIPPQRPGL